MQGYINDDNDRLLLFTIVIIMTSLFTALYLLQDDCNLVVPRM